MDVRELRYFVAVYEEGSLTRAARRCHVSQPSLSAAMAALELNLQTTLFLRHKRGVTRTAAAETLYARARPLVDEVRALRDLFKEPEQRPTLTLGLMKTLDIARTTALIAPLSRRPEFELQLVDASQPCDGRIVSKSMVAESEVFVPLWREEYVLAISSSHILASAPSISRSDLSNVSMVRRCYCESADLIVRGDGDVPKFVATAESEDWALAFVAAGLGATILPEGVVGERDDITVRYLSDFHLDREVGLSYSKTPTPTNALVVALQAMTG